MDRLYLVNSASRICYEHGVDPGRFVMMRGDKIISCRDTLRLKFANWNPVAINYGDGEVQKFYNVKDQNFQDIVELANSDHWGNGVAYGVDLYFEMDGRMVYWPCVSKTLRKFAMDIRKHSTRQTIDVVGLLYQTKEERFKWYGPRVVGCTAEDLNIVRTRHGGKLPSYEEVMR